MILDRSWKNTKQDLLKCSFKMSCWIFNQGSMVFIGKKYTYIYLFHNLLVLWYCWVFVCMSICHDLFENCVQKFVNLCNLSLLFCIWKSFFAWFVFLSKEGNYCNHVFFFHKYLVLKNNVALFYFSCSVFKVVLIVIEHFPYI